MDATDKSVLDQLANPDAALRGNKTSTTSKVATDPGAMLGTYGSNGIEMNMSKLQATNSKLKTQVSTMKDNLNDTGQKMLEVTTTKNFAGKAQKNMKKYAQEAHVNNTGKIVNSLEELTREFDKQINNFKSSVDNSDSSIIKNNYLDTLSSKISKISSSCTSAVSEANSGESKASAAGAATKKLSSKSSESIDDGKKLVDKLKGKMSEFSARGISATADQINFDLKEVDQNVQAMHYYDKSGLDAKSKFAGLANLDNVKAQIKMENQTRHLGENFLDALKNSLSSDEYKRLKQLLQVNPGKAIEEMFKSDKLADIIRNNKKLKNMVRNFEINLTFFKEFNPETSKAISKTLNWANNINKYLPDLANLNLGSLGKSVIKGTDKIKESAVGKMGSGKMAVFDIGMNITADYVDQKGKRDVGRAMSDGLADTVTGIGPVSGAMYGAEFGPVGAAIGGGIGIGIWTAKMIDPNLNSEVRGAFSNVGQWFSKAAKSAG